MTALLEYLGLTALLEYINLLNGYSRGPSWGLLGPFQAGARGKMPQFPLPVGGPGYYGERLAVLTACERVY